MELIEELELDLNPKMIKMNLIIEKLNSLKDIYEQEKGKSPISESALEAYHNWFVPSNTFFRNYFPTDDADLQVFTDVDINQDGYGLYKSYTQQRYAYNNLLSKINSKVSDDLIKNNSKKMNANKKIFISHSSLDKDVVDQFVDKILKLGLGLKSDDIACTSREDTGVKTGEDIRNFIKDNISQADFVFFMISDNYKTSEICLNEMGAAWATDRDVKPILLPNVGFDSIGWLYNVNKGVVINDSAGLDLLSEDICEKLDIKPRMTVWNKHKGEFLNFVNTYTKNEPATEAIVLYEETGELDLLDCREIFDEKMALSSACIVRIGEAFTICTENTNKSGHTMEILTNNPNTTPAQIRPVLLKLSHDTDKLSEVLEAETPTLKKTFEGAMDACRKLKQLGVNDNEQLEEEKNTLNGMIENMTGFMHAAASVRTTIQKDIVNLDKSYTKAKNRLIKKLTDLIDAMQFCINKANELVLTL